VEVNQTDVIAAIKRITERYKETVCTKFAAEAEQLAKVNAPWTDRTGDARKLIKGVVFEEPDAIGIRLLHRVEYGPALETKNSGKYAILRPTIESLRSEFFSVSKQALGVGQ